MNGCAVPGLPIAGATAFKTIKDNTMTTGQPAPFRVTDLIAWAEIADFAAQAKDPKWPYRDYGIWMHSGSCIPHAGAQLPNGFQFPTTTMNDLARGVFLEAIRRYHGPDPTTCAGFLRAQRYIAKTYQAELTTETARRIRLALIGEHSVAPDQASAMPLDEAMDRLDPPAPVPKQTEAGGRKPLTESADPKARAKLNAYRQIREVWVKNPSWGEPELLDHFERNKSKSFMDEVRASGKPFDKRFVHAAVEWLRANEPVQTTPSENVS